jgi:hypothetical protein
MLFSRWFGEESNLDLRDFTPALVRISYQTRLAIKGRPQDLRVEKAGIEPAASALQRRRSPNVSYIPNALLSVLEEARIRSDLRPPRASSHSRAG